MSSVMNRSSPSLSLNKKRLFQVKLFTSATFTSARNFTGFIKSLRVARNEVSCTDR